MCPEAVLTWVGRIAHHGGLGGAGFVAELVLADGLDEIARVDLDGALNLAHAVSRAGLLALVLVDLAHLIQPAAHGHATGISTHASSYPLQAACRAARSTTGEV